MFHTTTKSSCLIHKTANKGARCFIKLLIRSQLSQVPNVVFLFLTAAAIIYFLITVVDLRVIMINNTLTITLLLQPSTSNYFSYSVSWNPVTSLLWRFLPQNILTIAPYFPVSSSGPRGSLYCAETSRVQVVVAPAKQAGRAQHR